MSKYEYDVALCFAGEDRKFVYSIADNLRELDLRVFYDEYEEVNLWGKVLYAHLSDVYHKKSKLYIVFISKYYKEKLWTNHDRSSVKVRAFEEKGEYILLVKLDGTEIPEITKKIDYINAKEKNPEDISFLITQKLDNYYEKENRKKQIIFTPYKWNVCESKLELLKNITKKNFRTGYLTENVLANIKSMNFREEWQYIVNQLVSETKKQLRAMVFDRELKRWWNTTAGQIYMMTNLDLLKKGIEIKRLFILSSLDIRVRKNALINAYVHHKLGINVKICTVDYLNQQLPFKADMFSVHDNDFVVLYFFSIETPTTNIITEHKYIADFLTFYDDFFYDDRFCSDIIPFLKSCAFDKFFLSNAKRQLIMLKKMSKFNSLVKWIKFKQSL
jgi:hypothetical protein